MATEAEIIEGLTNDALRPKKVRTETAEVERHSLPDQIAAVKFLLSQAGARNNRLGIRFRKFIPGSTNGQVSGDISAEDGEGS